MGNKVSILGLAVLRTVADMGGQAKPADVINKIEEIYLCGAERHTLVWLRETRRAERVTVSSVPEAGKRGPAALSPSPAG